MSEFPSFPHMYYGVNVYGGSGGGGAGASGHSSARTEYEKMMFYAQHGQMYLPNDVNCGVYQSVNALGYRTVNQDREIEELRTKLDSELKRFDEKEKKEKDSLKDLIAHYYNKQHE